MGRGGNTAHFTGANQMEGIKEWQILDLEPEPLFIRFLRTFKEVLKFILFSYTVLFGALLLAQWTTYFVVAKYK